MRKHFVTLAIFAGCFGFLNVRAESSGNSVPGVCPAGPEARQVVACFDRGGLIWIGLGVSAVGYVAPRGAYRDILPVPGINLRFGYIFNNSLELELNYAFPNFVKRKGKLEKMGNPTVMEVGLDFKYRPIPIDGMHRVSPYLTAGFVFHTISADLKYEVHDEIAATLARGAGLRFGAGLDVFFYRVLRFGFRLHYAIFPEMPPLGCGKKINPFCAGYNKKKHFRVHGLGGIVTFVFAFPFFR